MKQTIEEIEVSGKRVLIRSDFNVPMQDGAITDDRRIRMALPTIESVLNRGGDVIIMSHLGRPSGNGFEEKYSLKLIAKRLSELLGKEVVCSDEDTSSPIVLRENVRFHKEEKAGSDTFAKELAVGADIYCNDAFGTAHRSHTSMVALPQAMQGKPRVAGLLLAKELQYLGRAIKEATHPFVVVLGGAKVSDKIGVIEHLLGTVDTILIGGAMAYTFLKAKGIEVGSSLIEKDRIEDAKKMLNAIDSSSTEVFFPVDHVCTKEIVSGSQSQVTNGSIPPGWTGVDIGPATSAEFADILSHAKTVVWNGPMGVFEIDAFSAGTKCIAHAIAQVGEFGAVTIVGGGDSCSAIAEMGIEDKITHISTGGGASLQMLEGIEFSSVALLDDAV